MNEIPNWAIEACKTLDGHWLDKLFTESYIEFWCEGEVCEVNESDDGEYWWHSVDLGIEPTEPLFFFSDVKPGDIHLKNDGIVIQGMYFEIRTAESVVGRSIVLPPAYLIATTTDLFDRR